MIKRVDDIKNLAGSSLEHIKVVILRNVKYEDLVNKCKDFDRKDEEYNEILSNMSLPQ